MTYARVLGIVGITVLAAAAAVAYAQTTVTPIPDVEPVDTAPLVAAAEEKATWGDVQNGQTLAGTCAACHGLDGNPPIEMYPRMAGQSELYIANQIALFKSGERSGGMAAVMKPFADMLSAQDARDVGAYYATQKSGAGVADDSLVASGPYEGLKFYEIGEQLFRAGDAERGIPACMACHGPDGAGNPGPAYPHVAGQQAGYTQQRLEMYRAGVTNREDSHLFDVMASISKSLTDQEIGALASYLQGLHPAADDRIAMVAGPAAPVAAAPVAAAPVDAAPVDAAAEGAEGVDGADVSAVDPAATEAATTEAATDATEAGDTVEAAAAEVDAPEATDPDAEPVPAD